MGCGLSTESVSQEAIQDTRPKIEQIIATHAVVVFAKSYCPYCQQAKSRLNGMNVQFYALDLDKVSDGRVIQQTLAQMTGGQTSVPNIFIAGQHIGGNSELQAEYKRGTLQKRLQRLGVQ